MTKNFVHLHVHTEYSLLDGAARIDSLLDAAKNFGMPAIAMTDHGTMYGTIDFYRAAKKRGIKPIIGCEVYLAKNSVAERNKANIFHLVLLAENNEGYQNLIKLVSLASTDGFYYKPRVDKTMLEKYHGGLIALSACVQGEIPQEILKGGDDCDERVAKLIEEYVEIFGRENFFLEIQNHGVNCKVPVQDEEIFGKPEEIAARKKVRDFFAKEEKIRAALKRIAPKLGVGLVATNDVHYIEQADSEIHDLLLCIQTNAVLRDTARLKFYSDEYFLRSPAQMHEIFADFPDACENTLKIAARCNVEIEFGKLHLPKFKIPPNFETEMEYLRDLCRKKIFERYEVPDEKIFARLNYELSVIEKMGYAGYFLIVQDFINYAKDAGIAVGPGRGSAAGSFVAYVLGITEINPIELNLLFERFLNPERVTMPDIDIDFCYKRRDEVITYVRKTYGEDHVAQILTFGTMAAKAAIRDVVRVMSKEYNVGSRLIEMMPRDANITIADALKTSKKFSDAYETEELSKTIIDFAQKLEGFPRHTSIHAAGIVISQRPLVDYLPLQKIKDNVVTQFDKDKVEMLGLLKMDFLGLRTLTVINDTVASIKKISDANFDVQKIPTVDIPTAELLSSGETLGVFQMESAGMTKLVIELKPTCYEDLIPTIALFRPGPLGSGMVKDFVDGKHGRRKPTYLHPKLEPILRETFGVILYQEQVMQIVQALAGFTLGQADILRRAMSKKNVAILDAQKENFLKGCRDNGIEIDLAEKIFALLEHFADYGFNKSHSAAYALLAWQTAYLKVHYPAEFMAATLSSVMDSDKVATYLAEAKRLGLTISPPDINGSSYEFTGKDTTINFALSAVKNVGKSIIEHLVAVRGNKNFASLTDFCSRIDSKIFGQEVIKKLIKCGAFDKIKPNRNWLLGFLDNSYTAFRSKNPSLAELLKEENFNPSDVKTTPQECLTYEKEVLGFYVSGHPLDDYKEKMSHLDKISDVKKMTATPKPVKIGGVISNCSVVETKKTKLQMAFITVEDLSDTIKATVFSAQYEKFSNHLKAEKIVVIDGTTNFSNDELKIFVDNVTPIEEYTPTIFLKVPAQLDNAQTRQTLKKIITGNAGESELCIKFGNKRWKVVRNLGNVSTSNEVLSQFKKLLGDENVKVK